MMPKLYQKLFFGQQVLDDLRPIEEWEKLFKQQGPLCWGYPPGYIGNFADWQEVGEIKEVRRAAR